MVAPDLIRRVRKLLAVAEQWRVDQNVVTHGQLRDTLTRLGLVEAVTPAADLNNGAGI